MAQPLIDLKKLSTDARLDELVEDLKGGAGYGEPIKAGTKGGKPGIKGGKPGLKSGRKTGFKGGMKRGMKKGIKVGRK